MRSHSFTRSPWRYVLIATAPLAVFPAIARTANATTIEDVEKAQPVFLSCVQNNMAGEHPLPYLQSVETCKGILPPGSTIDILAPGMELTRWYPSNNSPAVLPSLLAFEICSGETATQYSQQNKSSPPREKIVKFVNSCRAQYYPVNSGTHPKVRFAENGFDILIVPDQKPDNRDISFQSIYRSNPNTELNI